MSDQSKRALKVANHVRTARRKLRDEIAKDPQLLMRVIAAPFDYVRSCEIGSILRGVPSIGPMKTDVWCAFAQVNPATQLVSLTNRQRMALLNGLKTYFEEKESRDATAGRN